MASFSTTPAAKDQSGFRLALIMQAAVFFFAIPETQPPWRTDKLRPGVMGRPFRVLVQSFQCE
jgi:hypothetical protein